MRRQRETIIVTPAEIEHINQEDVPRKIMRKGSMGGFEEIEILRFEMRNVFLTNQNANSQLRQVRHFFNRPDVMRQPVIKALSSEAYQLFKNLIQNLPMQDLQPSLNTIQKLHLKSPQLTDLLHCPLFSHIRLRILDIICLNLKRWELDGGQQPELCELCRVILTQELFPKFDFATKYCRIYITLIAYLLKHGENRQTVINECKGSFIRYFQSNQKRIAEFFQELLGISELHKILEQFVVRVVMTHQSLDHDFEEYLAGNLTRILTTLKTPTSTLSPSHQLSYLCLKLKSLTKPIRLASLRSLISFPHLTKPSVQLMITKDLLNKTVDHTRGILLLLLQDQFSSVRVLTITCLQKFSLYLDKNELKQILFYMINDDSEQVRIESLRALIKIAQDYTVTADDLSIMLMCLKDSRIQFRYYVYRLAAIVTILSEVAFLGFVDRFVKTLKGFKEDKVYLYRAMKGIGRRCAQFVLPNVKQILDIGAVDDQTEPNWKNILYKARVILIANCFADNYYQGIKQNSSKLPPYFLKHFQYIHDVQPYAFQKPQPLKLHPSPSYPSYPSSSSSHSLSQYNLTSKHNKLQYLRASKLLWSGPQSQLDSDQSPQPQPQPQPQCTRFLKKLFSSACLLYDLESVLTLQSPYEMRWDSILQQTFKKLLKIEAMFGRSQMDGYLREAKVECLLFLLLRELHPIYMNKQRLSEVTIFVARALKEVQGLGVGEEMRRELGRLEVVNKAIMTELGDKQGFQVQTKQLVQSMRNFSAFQTLFTLLQTTPTLPSPTPKSLKLSISPHSTSTLLTLQVQLFGDQKDLSTCYLKFERVGEKQQYVRILQGDRVDSLEDSHKVMYLVSVGSRPRVSRVVGVRRVMPELMGDRGEVEGLLRVVGGVEGEAVVEMCWISITE